MVRFVMVCLLVLCCVGCSGLQRPAVDRAEVAAASWLACALAAPQEVSQTAETTTPKGLPQAIVFGATWCEHCVPLKQMLLAEMPQREWRIGNDGDIRLIDIDEQPELMKRYQIDTVPAVILVRISEGREVIIKRLTPAEIPRDANGFAKMLNKNMPGGWRKADP